MSEEPSPPPSAHVKAALLKEPLYLEDGALWSELLRSRLECSMWFAGVGLELVIDEEEGYAFVHQPDAVEGANGPKLIARRKLGYEPTLLLACLRQELAKTEARDADQVRLVRTRREICELVSGFLSQTTDETRARLFAHRRASQMGEFMLERMACMKIGARMRESNRRRGPGSSPSES